MVRKSLAYLFGFLVLTGLACNLPSTSEEPSSVIDAQTEDVQLDQEKSEEKGQTAASDMDEVVISEEPQTADGASITGSASVVGMREGLASLDSYQTVLKTIINGPTPQDRDETEITIRFSSADDARHIQTKSLSSSAEYPEIYESVEDAYQIGLRTCTVSTGDGTVEASVDELTPLMQDMVNSTTSLFDVVVTPPNPTLIGSETVNGIDTDHYTFSVSGLGDYSGEEVTQSDGEYWIAKDGRYLVKYLLILEVRTAPEGDVSAEVMHSEYQYELSKANQPVSIAMPSECVSAELDQS